MYPQLASSDTGTFNAPPNLFAGEAPVTTNRAQVGSNINLPQYTIVALVNNLLVACDPTGSGDVTIPVGILCTPGDSRTVGGTPGTWAPYYTGGDFNHDALVWPAGTSTFAARKKLFEPLKTIKISQLVDR